jgi:uncharacterized protein DUF903
LNKLIPILALAFVVGGCASSEYIVGTKSGNLLRADGKPKLNEKTGMYEFQDKEGRTQSVAKDQVVDILER